MENSIVSLNQKIELPNLQSVSLLDKSVFQYDLSRSKGMRHIEIDNYQNPASLYDLTLESVVLDGRKTTNEGLMMLENLLRFEVCRKNKETTVQVETLYTPWDPSQVELPVALEEELKSDSELSPSWDTKRRRIVITKRSTAQKLIIEYQDSSWAKNYYTKQEN